MAEAFDSFQKIINKSGLEDFGNRIHDYASVAPGADVITSTVFIALDFAKYLVATIAVIYLIISGIKLVTAGRKVDEELEKEKENFKLIIYGLIIIIIGDQLVTKVFFGDYGECIASATNAQECAKAGGSIVKSIYSFILSIIATFALFILVLAGFRLASSAGEEEAIGRQKRRIAVSAVALLVAGVAEFVVKKIVFPAAGTEGINVAAANELVLRFTNFIAAFIGISAFAMLFYGGIIYVASFGNEEKTGKAKKIMLGAIIGVAIALAAYGAVNTLVAFTK